MASLTSFLFTGNLVEFLDPPTRLKPPTTQEIYAWNIRANFDKRLQLYIETELKELFDILTPYGQRAWTDTIASDHDRDSLGTFFNNVLDDPNTYISNNPGFRYNSEPFKKWLEYP